MKHDTTKTKANLSSPANNKNVESKSKINRKTPLLKEFDQYIKEIYRPFKSLDNYLDVTLDKIHHSKTLHLLMFVVKFDEKSKKFTFIFRKSKELKKAIAEYSYASTYMSPYATKEIRALVQKSLRTNRRFYKLVLKCIKDVGDKKSESKNRAIYSMTTTNPAHVFQELDFLRFLASLDRNPDLDTSSEEFLNYIDRAKILQARKVA
ncbi:hypothetical protein [Helicobacter sp. 11S02629-2]|uniref:hypothetical protein n=1 Tax=Helicobacter sp. 11S02629-2 TaxID=1476195 RepID=UPI000BA68A08|nr:hypothetical protein [Helicobacter sp. 11S02629-2]PAF42406.1 hypothetical protein BKH40_07815 [Helicobacter sp. 11S02629-2]